MKRKILVLDAYTNGYEAALRFIRKRNWKRTECDIITCGSHGAIMKRLSESPGFAVLPIHNSTKGEVVSVTRELQEYRDRGFTFNSIDSLPLRINHYLMAPPHITSVNELERVMSKDEAMGQCDIFLKSVGLTSEKRSKRDSTGSAARAAAHIGKNAKIGAVAPKCAARAYGLRILASKIQDNKKNTTTFHLIENKMEVKPVVVGIIGINGRFGQLLKEFFQVLGCSIIGSDRKNPTELSNIEVVKGSDVVIFAIPIKRTVPAIREIIPYTRENQMLMDITSVKQPVIEAMLKGRAQVVGLHPMFAPELGFSGQTVVVCPGRLTNPAWKSWVVNMLAATTAKQKWTTGKEHDMYMATVQVSPQSANLINALLIMRMGVSTKESLNFTSPFYRVMFSLMGRFLSQNAEMYGSIFMKNPATIPMLRARIRMERQLLKVISDQDMSAFAGLYDSAKNHFGEDVTREANELFQRLNAVLKSFYSPNSVIFEFAKWDSKPRMLEKILREFGKRGINLTDISSVARNDRRFQVTLSFEGSKHTLAVQSALKHISGWSQPRIQVIG